MSKRKIVLGLAALIVITVLVGQSLCSSGVRGGQRPPRQGAQQPQQEGQRAQRGGQRPGGAPTARDYEQMQDMMLERMKTQIKVSDEKWPTVKPLLKNVSTLQEQLNPRFRGGMMGARGPMGPGGRPGADQPTVAEAPKTELEKATDGLQTALRAEAPKADDIKAKLAALRTARDKVKKELAKAESDLKAQLTVEQEANLVIMGRID